MADEDFFAALELTKKIERNMLPYAPFEGKIDIVKTIDLYPKEYENLSYEDLLNAYKRVEKIIKAPKMEIYTSTTPPQVEKKIEEKKEEIESKVKEITVTTLEQTEEMKVVAPVEEMPKLPEEKHEEKPKESELDFGILEFEKPPVEKKLEFEKPPVEKKVEIEKPPPPPEKKLPEPEEVQKEVSPPIPSVLEAAAAEAASTKYSEIEEYFKREWGGEIDERKIKKKMLELTKELFKEKSVKARERIKREVVVLKGMLAKIKVPKKKAKIRKASYSAALLETLTGTQEAELSTTKDAVASEISKKAEELKKAFYDSIARIDESNEDARKAEYEKFVFQITTLSEQLPAILSQREEYLVKKHCNEIENFINGLPEEETQLRKTAESRINSIAELYRKAFDTIKEMQAKKIESIIDIAGREVFKERETEEEGIATVLYEIEETDDATLLYYLHSKNPDFYKKYERKHVSKSEALQAAKILMAKEKGLSDSAISKYFGHVTEEG